MKTIGAITTSRADYGILRPVLRCIQESTGLELELYVTGSHTLSEFGETGDEIKTDGFPIASTVAMPFEGDGPEKVVEAMGEVIKGFAKLFETRRPDFLLILGDRYELIAAALASVPFNIPIAHIHGGELTEGAIDNAFRHALTKLSHLHFVAMAEYGDRVVQMGEDPARVTVCGAPALDNLAAVEMLSEEALSSVIGMPVASKTLLVTFHPATLEGKDTEWQLGELLAAVGETDHPAVFTGTNTDVMGQTINKTVQSFCDGSAQYRFVPHLGTQTYFSLMAHAGAMVGNSSSGIIEAASFRLPVVNIGTRQKGRLKASNVIDVEYGRDSVLKGIKRALAPAFRADLADIDNPYGDGQAAERIIHALLDAPSRQELLTKVFHDASPPAAKAAIHV